MPNSPFVSVIVPFFNIELCVEYCLSSLKAQTYQNCEFILVDDGSSDNTGRYLDECSKSDTRFRVFHKKNGGLSDARNYGVKQAHGEYITFVDGDDFVSPSYVRSLVRGLDFQGGIDLVIGVSKRVPFKKIQSTVFGSENKVRKISNHDLCLALMYEELYPSAWAHLAPKSVYEKVNFPENCYYEEIATIASFVKEAESYAVIDEPIYGYVVRDGSIVHKKGASKKQIEDYERAVARFEEYMIEQGYQDSKALTFFKCLHYSRIYRLLDSSSNKFKTDKRKKIERYIKEKLKGLLGDSRIGRGNKARFLLLATIPVVYTKVFALYDAVRG